MWTSVLVAVVVITAPAADGERLTLANVRPTYGVLGPRRTDNKILPGDLYVLSFDIQGVTLGADGKVAYSMSTELSNSTGRIVYKQDAKPVEAPASLGGGRVPAHAKLNVGLDAPPGTYTLTVHVTDRISGAAVSLSQTAEVAPKEFGLVRLAITNDPDGQLPAAALGVGQAAWLQLGAVGFSKPANGSAPAVSFSLRLLDESGKPTQQMPIDVRQDVQPSLAMVPVQFLLSLNRSGRFTAEITATDSESKKTATLSVPILVTEPK
jgi:hypothetical protein